MKIINFLIVLLLAAILTPSIDCSAQNQTNMYYSGEMNVWGATSMSYRNLDDIKNWAVTILSDGDDSESEFKISNTTGSTDKNWSAEAAVALKSYLTYYEPITSNSNFNETNTKYYTFTIEDVASGNSNGFIMETSASPVTIPTVSQVGGLYNGIYYASSPGQTVNITLSAAKSSEEKIYVVFTNDTWVSHHFVNASGTGTSYTATIPYQTPGTSMQYYVISTTLTYSMGNNLDNFTDLATINYNNNLGNKYSYLVTSPATNAGNWNQTATWLLGEIPGTAENVIIANTVTVTNTPGNAARCNELTIENGKSLIIGSTGALTVDDAFTNFGVCTIQSDASSTGSLINYGSISGNDLSLQRYISAWSDATHGWHHLSSPVLEQFIQPEFVPNPPSASQDFYKWDETSTTTPWINSKSNSGSWNSSFESKFADGVGYLVAYQTNQTKTFSGAPSTSNISKSSLSYTAGNSNSGWNLLGNPFTSALIWNQNNWALNKIDGVAKIWNESTATYTDVAQGEIIPVTQGFMVHVSDDPGTGGSLTINADDRTHNDQNWYKSSEVNKIKITAYDTENNTAQESIIRINANATSGFDTDHDSRFLLGYGPQFYSVIAEANLSTNSIPGITSSVTIPFSFIKNNSSTFYIEAEGIDNLEPHETVYLTDTKTNHTQILNDEPRYDFISEEGDIAERFIIHFSPLSVNEITIENVNVFSLNNCIEVRTNKPIMGIVRIYNIAGQLITTSQLVNESSGSISVPNYKGAAIVSIITSKQAITKKVIIR